MDVYHNEPLSQRAIANRFGVALSLVQKLIKQYRETQNIAPRKYDDKVDCQDLSRLNFVKYIKPGVSLYTLVEGELLFELPNQFGLYL